MAEFLSQDEIDALLDIAEQGEKDIDREVANKTDIERVIEHLTRKEQMYEVDDSFKYLQEAVDKFCYSTIWSGNTKVEEMIRLSYVCYVLDGLIKTYNTDFEEMVKFYSQRGFVNKALDDWDDIPFAQLLEDISLTKSIPKVIAKLKEIK